MNKKKVSIHVGICGLLAVACGFYVHNVIQWAFVAIIAGVLMLALEPMFTRMMPSALYGKLCIVMYGLLCLVSVSPF